MAPRLSDLALALGLGSLDLDRDLTEETRSTLICRSGGTAVSRIHSQRFASGTPVVDRTFPLSEVCAAMSYLQDGGGPGKIIITP